MLRSYKEVSSYITHIIYSIIMHYIVIYGYHHNALYIAKWLIRKRYITV